MKCHAGDVQRDKNPTHEPETGKKKKSRPLCLKANSSSHSHGASSSRYDGDTCEEEKGCYWPRRRQEAPLSQPGSRCPTQLGALHSPPSNESSDIRQNRPTRPQASAEAGGADRQTGEVGLD